MKAVGIVRVSQVAGREGESFASPGEQADRIRAECASGGLELVELFEELDVSGGTPLERREGLRTAVEMVEAGDAHVVVAAYFDRLVRSLRVQDELVSRVERAGGRVMALDVGEVSEGTAGKWLSGTLLGAVAEYQRRTSAERSRAAQVRAVARGVVPFDRIPPGYTRSEAGTLEPDDDAPAVVEAFRLRAGGATIAEVRAHLAAHGIVRSYRGVQSLLGSRIVLGEIHFGELSNLAAHEPIVDRDLWRRVQEVPQQRGRRPKSERLLARLGVLRCSGCGGRMVVGTQTQGGRSYPFYRCGRVREDCHQRVAISAELVEGLVVEAVQRRLRDDEGRAGLERNAREAEARLEQAQQNLDAALRAFGGLTDEPAARERLGELAALRNEARQEVERLGGTGHLVVTSRGWDVFTDTERRALIRAVVDTVTVAPGRGTDRVTVRLRQ